MARRSCSPATWRGHRVRVHPHAAVSGELAATLAEGDADVPLAVFYERTVGDSTADHQRGFVVHGERADADYKHIIKFCEKYGLAGAICDGRVHNIPSQACQIIDVPGRELAFTDQDYGWRCSTTE